MESRFGQLKEKEKLARKQIVIESALALFSKKPFFKVGIRDVAREAGISPATIYRYFPSQEELFNEVFLQSIASVSKEFKTMVQKDKPASIEEFSIKFVDHLIENESTFQMTTYLMLKSNEENPIIGRFNSITRIFFNLFEQLLIRHGVEKESARIYSHSYIASITGILMAFRHYPKDKKAIRQRILKIIKTTSSLYTDQLINKTSLSHGASRVKG
ncbi:MAG: TetR/AcrR family transcriptional regulator [Deltaproteobacteria bacterium]|nr:TetR/AcrR family transcriptional regulator [Deltaproteobacteria bacterium]